LYMLCMLVEEGLIPFYVEFLIVLIRGAVW